MSEINPIGRPQVIAGLRALADYLETHPNVPADEHWELQHHTPGTTAERRAEVDRIAAVLGTKTTGTDHYKVSRMFGPVRYSALGISVERMARHAAERSYTSNVQVDAPAKAVA